ncbi:ligase-associated DNA damage response endonuclease PdeM [uncultured Boseongicola sp.]|uniref:ligase-associated DNA damage response endonuclease PdeM n=1 Tax=uncultured Boseongicola sp. TaxID=1648499 RepID=UPI00261B0A01|nr:ligase-associated DNA damage response endonuclease PdeM [uncultured Boseongicola sp.]
MNATISFCDEQICLLPTGALYWPRVEMLVISDLHLGKSERIARQGGTLLPPYETTETLTKLSDAIEATEAKTVLCLGDSFDDRLAAAALDDVHVSTLQRLQAGRRWLWIEGNHDPGPLDLAGTHLSEHREGPFVFRHIAASPCESGEISGHYHPKARIRHASGRCFLVDHARMILPAFGAYTGGLSWTTPELRRLFAAKATAYLTGRRILAVPVPRAARSDA